MEITKLEYDFIMSNVVVIKNGVVKKDNEKVIMHVMYNGKSCMLKIYINQDLTYTYDRIKCEIKNFLHIPKIFESFVYKGNTYIIESKIDGLALNEIISEDEGCGIERAVEYIEAVAEAVKELHDMNPPIIHRDIKPQNVIIAEDGLVKLIDFDIARKYDEKKANDTVCMGTRGYAAPEQYGFGQTTIRTDIFAIGVLFQQLLSGTVECRNVIIRGKYAKIIEKCIKFAPEERFENIDEFLKEIRKCKEKKIVDRRKIIKGGICVIVVGTLVMFVLKYDFVRNMINSKNYGIEKNISQMKSEYEIEEIFNEKINNNLNGENVIETQIDVEEYSVKKKSLVQEEGTMDKNLPIKREYEIIEALNDVTDYIVDNNNNLYEIKNSMTLYVNGECYGTIKYKEEYVLKNLHLLFEPKTNKKYVYGECGSETFSIYEITSEDKIEIICESLEKLPGAHCAGNNFVYDKFMLIDIGSGYLLDKNVKRMYDIWGVGDYSSAFFLNESMYVFDTYKEEIKILEGEKVWDISNLSLNSVIFSESDKAYFVGKNCHIYEFDGNKFIDMIDFSDIYYSNIYCDGIKVNDSNVYVYDSRHDCYLMISITE